MSDTVHIKRYFSPLGEILITADEVGLTGLWFDGEKNNADSLPAEHCEADTPILSDTKRWLDLYFAGLEPRFTPPLHTVGTPFRMAVWKILSEIPYGETVTYGDIAKRLAKDRGLSKLSAQAVGGAVGHNRISIIIPCHRVVGADGNLTGYAGGIERKIKLLELEQVDMSRLYLPRK